MHNEAIKMAKWAMADACAKGYDNMTSQDWDDFKDCVETAKNAIECDYYYRLVECMKKEEEEEKREDKYFLDMLKEEHEDEYRRMREEYGEDEGERRFYDAYRYKSSGRFAPKGRGTRYGRRGYTEPPYLHMPYDYKYDMDDYDYADAEHMRGMDRKGMNRLYFSEPMGGRDGHHDGTHSDRYEEGYRDGEKSAKGKESRYDRAKRGYEEVKSSHKGNAPEDKQLTMREMEKVLGVVFDEIDEMLEDASPEMKNMVKTKTMSRMQKIQ